jgi:DNA-binding NarL/FixJ family response regulator
MKSETGRKRIALVDDHALLREGLRQMIERDPQLEVCGEAEDVEEALALIEEQRPHLTILDLALRKSNGFDLIGQIKARFPSVRILVLSMRDERLYAERCLRAGAEGYVEKGDAAREIVAAVHAVLSDQIHLSQALSNLILDRVMRQGGEVGESAVSSLSRREQQLLELIGQGLTTQEIADRLDLSPKTVHTYRDHLKEKLHVDNLYQLVRYAVSWKLQHE